MIVTSTEPDPDAPIVRYGSNYALPARFRATVEPDDPGLPICHLTIAVEDGRAVCDDLVAARGPAGKPITGTALRELALGEYVKAATAKAAMRAIPAPVGNTVVIKFGEEDAELEATRIDDGWVALPTLPVVGVDRSERFKQAARRGKPARRRTRSRITDEELIRVAEVYRAAYSSAGPTKAVADELHLTRVTAGRHVKLARKRGFLGPTRPRVAGEDQPV